MIHRESKVSIQTQLHTHAEFCCCLCECVFLSHAIPSFPQQRTPNVHPTKYFSYAPSSSVGISPTAKMPPMRPQSMVLPSTTMGADDGRGNIAIHFIYQPR